MLLAPMPPWLRAGLASIDIIGQTRWATGPHLDYADIIDDGLAA